MRAAMSPRRNRACSRCVTLANAQTCLIRGATVHTVGEQGVLSNTDVLIRDGKIAAVGTGLSAPSGATTVDAKGRALTPGLFGGLSAIGVEEVSLEPTTADASRDPQRAGLRNAVASRVRRHQLPTTRARCSCRSRAIEGLTWTMLAPGSAEGGTFLAGQGAAVTLDGRYDAVLTGSRSLFINLGGNSNALSAGSRAGQWMLLDQAIRETRTPSAQDEHVLLHPLGREALAKYLSGGRVVFGVARAAEIRRAIAFAKRNGMKPVIAGGAEAWVVADELAREKVPVLLDALENLPYTFDGIGARLDNAALLHRRWRAHRVHAVQRESQRTQGPPARRQCGRARVAEGRGARGADGAACGDLRSCGRARPYRARPGRGSGAVERRSARSDERGGPGVDRRTRGGDALAADRAARPLPQTPAMTVGRA